jgi:uncharacterized membrane protein
MVTELLEIAVLVGSGTVAGVLFAVALSTLPALIAMPPGRYIYAHKLLGRNWDPTMPAIVLGSTVLDVVLAVIAPATVLFAFGAMLLVGVSVVSHFANVPINKVMRTLDPDHMPERFDDPRPLWRRWHHLRTALALLALLVNAVAIATS